MDEDKEMARMQKENGISCQKPVKVWWEEEVPDLSHQHTVDIKFHAMEAELGFLDTSMDILGNSVTKAGRWHGRIEPFVAKTKAQHDFWTPEKGCCCWLKVS